MKPVEKHVHDPDSSFDGGDLDCGNGLLLLLRQNLDKLEFGQLLEIRSVETSVEEDLPAWCRLTSNELVSWTKQGKQRSYLVRKGMLAADSSVPDKVDSKQHAIQQPAAYEKTKAKTNAKSSPDNKRTIEIPALSTMGIGSWPRPNWLMPYLHKYLEGKITKEEFDAVANDAVQLAVLAQTRAGVDLICDGEQRRDNYASFVGMRLNGAQLIPVTDLLPLVDDPEEFQKELASLDVPADKVRHPAVLGRLSRKGTIACDELEYLTSISNLPAKIALPGPYLLSRIMWMDCITDKVYASREMLAQDIVKILQEEIQELLDRGAALVQLDEPVLSEIVFTGAKNKRSFMCGALSERGNTDEELAFAGNLINSVCEGFPPERLAMHVCRGNWTPDESAALSGAYDPLLPLFNSIPVGTLFLEFCTPRAGELSVLKGLRKNVRVGLGSVNQKCTNLEPVEDVLKKAYECIKLLGSAQRLLLNPDCGFATFADNPVSSAELAEAKLSVLAKAAKQLKAEFSPG